MWPIYQDNKIAAARTSIFRNSSPTLKRGDFLLKSYLIAQNSKASTAKQKNPHHRIFHAAFFLFSLTNHLNPANKRR